ncbi:MAG: hypothetical protein OHK93_005746 [Ramalina farinacea]|uniref:Tetratricopeptide repeat protein 1 n=1 Tax=Ramalina farinacea TaxID=258253 RepID=A0AA43QLI5_9LECA|nr:hypothetical protein [Ramalina farinacea]
MRGYRRSDKLLRGDSSRRSDRQSAPEANHVADLHAQQESRCARWTRDPPTLTRFPPSEESLLLSESNDLKASANTTFTAGDFSTAISQYDKALASCPNYLDYEIAVLKSNIAACHLKLADWKAAVVAADAALEGMQRVIKQQQQNSDGKKKTQQQQNPQEKEDDDADADTTVVELDPTLDEATALAHLQQRDAHHAAIARIRTKSLMRRARAKSELGGWANLQAALDDYTTLSTMPVDALPPQDKKIIQAALKELPGKVIQAREAEMGEMMGKLKELGNSVLKPFGLSTDMFKMQKDERTGGYSMSINQ